LERRYRRASAPVNRLSSESHCHRIEVRSKAPDEPVASDDDPTMTTSSPPPARARLRDLGIGIGSLQTGPANSITDVPDVTSGHATVWRDEPLPPAGRGVARTGVTVVVPFEPTSLFSNRVPAGMAVLNGAGEMTGSLAIAEWGVLETPIFLTSTMAVGRVFDGAVAALVPADASIGVDDAIIPVVGECDDGLLNFARVVQVEASDVDRALHEAQAGGGAPVPEGVIGAGTGMVCFELKGGIGSSSRRIGDWVVGVMVLANFGQLSRLTIDGVPVGRDLIERGWATRELTAHRPHEQGSCIGLIATDAPMSPDQLARLARRAGLGLARTGSVGGHYSGEIFLSFTTGARMPRDAVGSVIETRRVAEDRLDGLFEAAVDATEEAVLNCLCAADTVTGTGGTVVPALPLDLVVDILRAHGRRAVLP
jgi:D-aminopeptidase